MNTEAVPSPLQAAGSRISASAIARSLGRAGRIRNLDRRHDERVQSIGDIASPDVLPPTQGRPDRLAQTVPKDKFLRGSLSPSLFESAKRVSSPKVASFTVSYLSGFLDDPVERAGGLLRLCPTQRRHRRRPRAHLVLPVADGGHKVWPDRPLPVFLRQPGDTGPIKNWHMEVLRC